MSIPACHILNLISSQFPGTVSARVDLCLM